MSLSLSLFAIHLTLSYVTNDKITKKHGIYLKRDYVPSLFILIALIISGMLTYINPNENEFKTRLNVFAGKEFPAKGLYRQADMIFNYLERNPELTQEDYYIDKGNMLLKVNKETEAMELFNTGLKIDFKRLEKNPSNPEIMTRIAKIYTSMGNMDFRRKYIKAALNEYERILSTSTSAHKKERAHMARGELFETLLDLNESINEYFKAAGVSPINSSFQPHIKKEIRRLLDMCQSDKKYTNNHLSWQKIQEIANQINRMDMKEPWCTKHK
jgi:tetratricopeptide (TPR) repeat protein